MRRDDQDVGSVRPVHNPEHATTELGDCLEGSRPMRVTRIRLDPIWMC